MTPPFSLRRVPGVSSRYSEMRTTLTLALGPAVSLGLARFAYALLLPPMRDAMHWSLAMAGAMNSANALGYLIGAVTCAPLARQYGSRRVFVTSFAVTAASLLVTAASVDVGMLFFLRLLAGASGAICFITGAGLVAQLGSKATAPRAALLLSLYFSGGGAGIVLSGLALPALLDSGGTTVSWRWGWVLLGALSIAALAVVAPTALATREPPVSPHTDRSWPVRRLAPLLFCYCFFGAGYIAYMTFIIAYLKGEGAGTLETTGFWVVLGVAAVTGGFVWARPISQLRGGRGAATVCAVLTLGALLPLLSSSMAVVILSALLFGGSFLAVVTAVTVVARRSLREHHWTPAIATLTVAFALGQSAGPILAGVLSEGPSGLRLGLELSVGVLALASVVAFAQRHHIGDVPVPVSTDV